MSIWSQLESDSKREHDFLNRAMTMLRVLAADPQIERYMKDKIIALDNEIEFYMKMDHKYRNCCVPFDLTELSPNNRMQDQPNATKQEGKP